MKQHSFLTALCLLFAAVPITGQTIKSSIGALGQTGRKTLSRRNLPKRHMGLCPCTITGWVQRR